MEKKQPDYPGNRRWLSRILQYSHWWNYDQRWLGYGERKRLYCACSFDLEYEEQREIVKNSSENVFWWPCCYTGRGKRYRTGNCYILDCALSERQGKMQLWKSAKRLSSHGWNVGWSVFLISKLEAQFPVLHDPAPRAVCQLCSIRACGLSDSQW